MAKSTPSLTFPLGIVFKLALPSLILVFLALLIKSSYYEGQNNLTLAISIDLLFTVPLVYFLTIRKSKISTATIIPVLMSGYLIGSILFQEDQKMYINYFKIYLLPLLEIGILTYIIFKVRQVIINFRKKHRSQADIYTVLKKTCNQLFPVLYAQILTSEIAVFYYGFFDWKKKRYQSHEFTYHLKSGTPALMAILIFIIVIETFAVHMLLEKWSNTAAWVLTALSIYTIFQFFGWLRSLSKRPIQVTNDKLYLKYGMMREVLIDRSDIQNIECSRKRLTKHEMHITLSPFSDLESHNVILSLTKPYELQGLFGTKKRFKTIAFHADTPKLLFTLLTSPSSPSVSAVVS
ncbi:hypothetical protein [Portibacter marinus]|uniref:hypothetical protein n=1 Tax=Portibacter marinus TaxID=2898660 RepID=UPI001F31051C|nr:hypothetical protein [Portibacter marinus]